MTSINREFVPKTAADARSKREFVFWHQRSDSAARHSTNDTDFAALEPEAEVLHPVRLPEIATQRIGRHVRKMYGAILRETAPDGVLRLVRQLELKERPD